MKKEEAIKELRSFIGQLTEGCQEVIKVLVPELKESEDERIRKELLAVINDLVLPDEQKARFNAWLEKQKEQNSEDEEYSDFTIYHPLKNGKGNYECIPYSFYGSLTSFSEDKDLIDFLRTCFYTEEECNEWIKQQKEQKPAEYLSKEKVFAIMNKLTSLSFCVPLGSDEEKKIHEITCDVSSLLDYPIEQKPSDVIDPFSNANFVRGYESGYADAKREQKPAEDWREKRKEECPFRRNLDNNLYGCERYADVISACTGACSWVVDYPKLKEIQDKKEQKPAESISHLTVQGKGVYKICPRCKERMVRDDSKVYTSMPPQYGYECPKCGEIEFDTTMYDNPEMEEQKPVDEQFPPLEGLDAIKAKYYDDGFKNGFDEGVESVKPAEWSEDDEKMRDYIIHALTNNTHAKEQGPVLYAKEIAWLQSLKNRGNFPKSNTNSPSEWSEDYREEDIQTRFAFYTYKDDPSTLYLSNVFVEEASRNHHFGTRILRAAEKVAETIGATTISLKVKQDSPANAWYRKNGYGYVTFEDGYDWLEKNLEYMKPNKQEWSEDDEGYYNAFICEVVNEKMNPTIEQVKWLRGIRDRLKSIQPQANQEQKEPSDKGKISDGYHTFNELYYYRLLYNAAFFNLLPKEWVHKSKRHHDGKECFGGGWFIVTANLPTGQISNHYEIKDWDLFHIPEKETADKWDGHTPQEAAERLHKFLLENPDSMPIALRDIREDKQKDETKITGWIARDIEFDSYYGTGLCLFSEKPEKSYDYWNGDIVTQLPWELFPDLKWNDEPMEVEITIRRK